MLQAQCCYMHFPSKLYMHQTFKPIGEKKEPLEQQLVLGKWNQNHIRVTILYRITTMSIITIWSTREIVLLMQTPRIKLEGEHLSSKEKEVLFPWSSGLKFTSPYADLNSPLLHSYIYIYIYSQQSKSILN